MCYEFIVPIGDAEVSVMFTFQNGGTEVEGASAREDGVFAVSHEIFQCSYNEKNISKNNEKSESNNDVKEIKEKEKEKENETEKINDDDKKKEKRVMDENAGQKIKVDVPSTATVKCTTSDGTCVVLQCMFMYSQQIYDEANSGLIYN